MIWSEMIGCAQKSITMMDTMQLFTTSSIVVFRHVPQQDTTFATR